MHWTAKYIGIPFRDLGRDASGCDCWGLVRLVLAGEHGIDLPSYADSYTSPDEHQEIAGLISGACSSTAWRPVDGVRDFDVLVFRRGRLDTHVGLVCGRGRMLHMAGTDQSKIDAYETGAWGNRLHGAFRHEMMRDLAV